MTARGLESITVLPWRRTSFNFPATIISVSTLSNGTVVANVAGSGIQLLNLDEGSATSRQLLPPTLTVHPFDEGKIITIVPTDRDRVMATVSQVLTIPAQKNFPVPTDRTAVLCASLEHKVAAHCFAEGGKEYLELCGFFQQSPQWTVQIVESPSAGSFSPACGQLVTFTGGAVQCYIHIWDVRNGRLLAKLVLDGFERLSVAGSLDITFDSEDTFYLHHQTYRTVYFVGTNPPNSPGLSHWITCMRKVPAADHSPPRQYDVDDGHEWVVSGSRRIGWIPPGYIMSAQASHCWAGSSLVMAGQDGTLRKLTFLE